MFRNSEKISEEPELSMLNTIMEEDELDGMQTFDPHHMELYTSEKIEHDTALAAATSPHDFKILLHRHLCWKLDLFVNNEVNKLTYN